MSDLRDHVLGCTKCGKLGHVRLHRPEGWHITHLVCNACADAMDAVVAQQKEDGYNTYGIYTSGKPYDPETAQKLLDWMVKEGMYNVRVNFNPPSPYHGFPMTHQWTLSFPVKEEEKDD